MNTKNFVDPSIEQQLSLLPSSGSLQSEKTDPCCPFAVDSELLTISVVRDQTTSLLGDGRECTVPELQELARAAESAIFGEEQQQQHLTTASFPINNNLMPFPRALVHLTQQQQQTPAGVVVATLLALNGLESAIRDTAGFTVGKSPLLKNMLDKTPDHLRPVLKTLLLPHDGLNLRNLLWHGFLSDIPRQWLALVIVLLQSLGTASSTAAVDEQQGSLREHSEPIDVPSLGKYEQLQHLLRNKDTLIDTESISSWLPSSHVPLFDLAQDFCDNGRPACGCAVLAILIEHGLRLDWCVQNARLEDRFARPGQYYVTLDGHGQRRVHGLLLHPYLITGDGDSRNALVEYLGPPTLALLTDLFCSPEGPNLRAAAAHGTWDLAIENELLFSVSPSTINPTPPAETPLRDCADLILIAMTCAAKHNPSYIIYTPLFSYTASAYAHLDKALQELRETELTLMAHKQERASDAVSVATDMLESMKCRVFRTRVSSGGEDPWTLQRFFEEYQSDVHLADHIAARALIKEIATFTSEFRILMCGDPTTTTMTKRMLKRASRLENLAPIVYELYSFALYVAMLSLGVGEEAPAPPETLQKAVLRTRMCVSTFATYVGGNSDRSIKALREFKKGRAVRIIIEHLRQQSTTATTFNTSNQQQKGESCKNIGR